MKKVLITLLFSLSIVSLVNADYVSVPKTEVRATRLNCTILMNYAGTAMVHRQNGHTLDYAMQQNPPQGASQSEVLIFAFDSTIEETNREKDFVVSWYKLVTLNACYEEFLSRILKS